VRTRRSALVVLALAVIGVLASTATAARPPTAAEKAAILLVFNEPGGRAFAAKCVRIRVSTVNRRWAMLTTPRRPPRACVESGQVGNGFVFFRRTATGGWRIVYEGSDLPPCSIPRPVRRDLLGTAECFRR
jgi:hypothetical protein